MTTDTNRALELKPCPFHGCGASLIRDGDLSWIECDDFDCQGPAEDTEAEAVAAWNRRPAPVPVEDVAGAGLSIWPDAGNPNNLRIVKNGASLCKVYGWDPDDAKAKADMICAALASPTQGADVERLAEACQAFALDPMGGQGNVEVICRDGIRREVRDHDFRRLAQALAAFRSGGK